MFSQRVRAAHAHIFGLPELSIPMMLHAVSIEMRFQLVRPEVDAV